MSPVCLLKRARKRLHLVTRGWGTSQKVWMSSGSEDSRADWQPGRGQRDQVLVAAEEVGSWGWAFRPWDDRLVLQGIQDRLAKPGVSLRPPCLVDLDQLVILILFVVFLCCLPHWLLFSIRWLTVVIHLVHVLHVLIILWVLTILITIFILLLSS